jgi:hypothetical protein
MNMVSHLPFHSMYIFTYLSSCSLTLGSPSLHLCSAQGYALEIIAQYECVERAWNTQLHSNLQLQGQKSSSLQREHELWQWHCSMEALVSTESLTSCLWQQVCIVYLAVTTLWMTENKAFRLLSTWADRRNCVKWISNLMVWVLTSLQHCFSLLQEIKWKTEVMRGFWTNGHLSNGNEVRNCFFNYCVNIYTYTYRIVCKFTKVPTYRKIVQAYTYIILLT